MQTADVVIIGGGCIGTSAAYHLTAMGCTDVVLLEADTLGSGSTSKAAGGVRMQHGDELNARIVQRSMVEFENFFDLTGQSIDFKQVGYLFLIDNAAHLEMFRRAVLVQQSLGIPSQMIDVSTAKGLVPPLETGDLVGATYCPADGYATPEALVQGYAQAARRLGATIGVGRRATAITIDHDRVIGVDTEQGPISCRSVVLSAGIHSAGLAREAGFALPVHGERRTIYYSDENADIPNGAPLTVDFSSGFYFRREGQGMIFAGRERKVEDLSESATKRLPVISEVPIRTSWWGNYDMSPDRNAMIGAAPMDGLFYATGFSGHGFQQSPAVGEHLAELVLGRVRTLELAALSADRFVSDNQRGEAFVI